MALPEQYAWLAKEQGPRILLEALKLYGIVEQPGGADNPEIIRWAEKTGLSKVYMDDGIPWCGLFMAYVAMQAGWEAPMNPLWARNWLKFGTPVKTAMLGDVLVFERGSGGHVAIYVGESDLSFHCLGGNQSDQVNIKRIAKDRLLGARRCPWRVSQPANVRTVPLAPTGTMSIDER